MNNKPDLKNSKYYFNRELSWLKFNERVFEEAQDKNNQLMERLKFLAITASNLDEFFMVRVSGLKELVNSGSKWLDCSGLTPKEQLASVTEATHELVTRQYNCLNRSLIPAMEREKIFFIKYKDLTSEQLKYVERYYNTTLFPILTPMAIDKSRPFPLLNNKSINLVVKLEKKNKKQEKSKKQENNFLYAVMQVPTVVPRIIKLPCGDGSNQFIFIGEIIRNNCDKLFLDHKVLDASLFRLTRNSDLEFEEEDTADLLEVIEKSIKGRKWGEPIRLEIEKNMNTNSRNFLKNSLDIKENEIYEINGPIDLTVFMKFTFLDEFHKLRDQPLIPQKVYEFEDKDIFNVISEKDVLVHHPYESFDPVVHFVENAASDPNVLAIKQTLYRVSGNSPVVHALIKAAENGKQVTVLVELMARFDEENNIIWAKKLEKSGCHVVYGLVGLKTHCKVCLVVRNEEDGIKRYVHMGTGNYNDSTAKIYTDLGLFTSNESFGSDISLLFNVLTGYSTNTDWEKISAAPLTLKKSFIKKINTEIENATNNKPAKILCKMNSLVDTDIIEHLYMASRAGVDVTLVVRGICCLRSGVKGVSDNIKVYSIVDRFLEHSRIFIFENDGNPEILLSSADWMPRNLNKRVEIAFPIEDKLIKEEILKIMEITLSDTQKLRVQQEDGTYIKLDKRGKADINSQLELYNYAKTKAEYNEKKLSKNVLTK